MSEIAAIAAIFLAAASGVPGLFLAREGGGGERLATWLMGTAGALGLLAGGSALLFDTSRELAAAWPVPGGRFVVRIDSISAMFIVQIALIAGLGAVYGLAYWPQAEHAANGRRLRLFYGLLTAGLLLQTVARNAVLFLAGWEMMALSAFMLIMTEDEKAEARDVSLVYLFATRFGTLAIFAMFALLAASGGTLDFDGWPRALRTPQADVIFVLGLVGFGLKAGVMPFHVWLPGAHATTPSHVSAVMSGVLIKMGIYGLVRLTAACDQPPIWWGHALIALGVVSGVLGVAFAIGQHDLKRLLAYHSVENIGIICIGLGVALLGRTSGRGELVVLGLAGALLHTWNHGLFKALLFLGAGSVLHATGTREIDRLGGLWRRMPRTGLAFLVGAVAICGLPPLNGLISELLIYLGLFHATLRGAGDLWLAGAFAAPALALIGGLAVACFVKVFGAVFLGSPRSAATAMAHESGGRMLAPMAILGALCLFIGVASPIVAPILEGAATAWLGRATPSLAAVAPLTWVSIACGALLLGLALAGWWVARLTRDAPSDVGTWDCGYAAPSPRMQYSASSFAQMIVDLFGWALRPALRAPRLEGPFPASTSFHVAVPDTVLDRGLRPAFSAVGRVFARFRLLQRGNVHLYILYIVATLLALLLWR